MNVALIQHFYIPQISAQQINKLEELWKVCAVHFLSNVWIFFPMQMYHYHLVDECSWLLGFLL